MHRHPSDEEESAAPPWDAEDLFFNELWRWAPWAWWISDGSSRFGASVSSSSPLSSLLPVLLHEFSRDGLRGLTMIAPPEASSGRSCQQRS